MGRVGCLLTPMATNNDPPLSTKQAAAILGLNHRSVARLVRQGKLKPMTQFDGIRGALVFDRLTVEALRDARAAR